MDQVLIFIVNLILVVLYYYFLSDERQLCVIIAVYDIYICIYEKKQNKTKQKRSQQEMK